MIQIQVLNGIAKAVASPTQYTPSESITRLLTPEIHDRDFFGGGRGDCDLFADSQYGTFGGDVNLSLWLSG